MNQKIDFSTASSDDIIAALCRRIDEIRLSRNISQADLAREAGVSRSTLTRIADGQAISLDSFVRVMRALRLTDHLKRLQYSANVYRIPVPYSFEELHQACRDTVRESGLKSGRGSPQSGQLGPDQAGI